MSGCFELHPQPRRGRSRRHLPGRAGNIGTPHSARAAISHTKVSYSADGKGKGWVGDVCVNYKVNQLSAGQYSATAKIPLLLWSASDGRLRRRKSAGLRLNWISVRPARGGSARR